MILRQEGSFLYFLATIKRDFPPISSPQSNRIWRTAPLIIDYTITATSEDDAKNGHVARERRVCIYILSVFF